MRFDSRQLVAPDNLMFMKRVLKGDDFIGGVGHTPVSGSCLRGRVGGKSILLACVNVLYRKGPRCRTIHRVVSSPSCCGCTLNVSCTVPSTRALHRHFSVVKSSLYGSVRRTGISVLHRVRVRPATLSGNFIPISVSMAPFSGSGSGGRNMSHACGNFSKCTSVVTCVNARKCLIGLRLQVKGRRYRGRASNFLERAVRLYERLARGPLLVQLSSNGSTSRGVNVFVRRDCGCGGISFVVGQGPERRDGRR